MNDPKIMWEAFSSLQRKHPTLIRRGFWFEHGVGWVGVLDRMFAELDRLVPLDVEFSLTQVKQKFGGIRVYYILSNNASDDLRDDVGTVIHLAECRSLRTCERCGRPGDLRECRHWYFTACDSCSSILSEGYTAEIDLVERKTEYVLTRAGWTRYDPKTDALVPSGPPPWTKKLPDEVG